MRALSLKQPYAELILQGKKTVELRKWNTKHRGVFLIHASKIPDNEAMKRFNFTSLPIGAIVGKATLVDVKHYKNKKEHSQDKSYHLGSEIWGNHGFLLENAQRLQRPIECKGALNFWTVPKHIEEQLEICFAQI